MTETFERTVRTTVSHNLLRHVHFAPVWSNPGVTHSLSQISVGLMGFSPNDFLEMSDRMIVTERKPIKYGEVSQPRRGQGTHGIVNYLCSEAGSRTSDMPNSPRPCVHYIGIDDPGYLKNSHWDAWPIQRACRSNFINWACNTGSPQATTLPPF